MFADLASLLRRFSELGAVRAFCKPLAENDNSKQQIYLCEFRFKLDTHSTANWTAIPAQTGH